MEVPIAKTFNESIHLTEDDINTTFCENIPVKIKKLNEYAQIPTMGSAAAAGYDIYAAIPSDVIIPAHETIKIGTGLAIAIPDNYWIGLFARSGLATKQGLRPANCIGVIDADYRGEIIAAIHNDSNAPQTITKGERIGQLIIMPRYIWNIEEVEELDDTKRGDGGFGSTGR